MHVLQHFAVVSPSENRVRVERLLHREALVVVDHSGLLDFEVAPSRGNIYQHRIRFAGVEPLRSNRHRLGFQTRLFRETPVNSPPLAYPEVGIAISRFPDAPLFLPSLASSFAISAKSRSSNRVGLCLPSLCR